MGAVDPDGTAAAALLRDARARYPQLAECGCGRPVALRVRRIARPDARVDGRCDVCGARFDVVLPFSRALWAAIDAEEARGWRRDVAAQRAAAAAGRPALSPDDADDLRAILAASATVDVLLARLGAPAR